MLRIRTMTNFLFFSIVVLITAVKADFLVNGGFEDPASIGIRLFNAGSNELTGWQILTGSVDTVPISFYPSFQGRQSLDLDGAAAGSISQSLSVLPGEQYLLSFAYANNPNPGATIPASFRYTLNAGSNVLLSGELTHQSSTVSQMNYSIFGQTFVPNSSNLTLSFASLNPSGSVGGIALDAVSITSVPEPTSLFLFSAAGIFIGWLKIRRNRSRPSAP